MLKRVLGDKQRHGYLLAGALAFLVRLLYLNQYASLPDWEMLTVDNYFHHHWAMNLAMGNIFGDTTYFRAPFYAWCLGALYALFEPTWWVGRLFGIAVGSISIALTWLIARKVWERPSVAWLAALLHALYPIAIYYDGELLGDSLFTLTCQLVILALLVWRSSPGWRIALMAGVAIGLAAITRPTILPMLLVAPLVCAGGGMRERTLQSGMMLLGALLLILPVTVRNWSVGGEPVLIASQGGINFFIGNNAESDGMSGTMPEPPGYDWVLSDVRHIAERESERPLSEGEISDYWYRQGWSWIREHPADFGQLIIRKCLALVANRETSNQRDLASFGEKIRLFAWIPLSFGVVLPLAMIGLVFRARTNPSVRIIGTFMLVMALVTVAYFVNSRFRLPLVPSLCVLAAGGGMYLWRSVWNGKTTRTLVTALAVLAIGIGSFLIGPTSGHTRGTGPYVDYAAAHIRGGEFREAIRSAQMALERDPVAKRAHHLSGLAYLRLQNGDSAEWHFRRELDHYPANYRALASWGSLSLVRGEADSALDRTRRALAIAPSDRIANQLYARILFALPTLAATNRTKLLDSIASRTGDDVFILTEAAIFATQAGDTANALILLDRAARSSPPPIETDDLAFERTFRNDYRAWERAKASTYLELAFLSGRRGDYVGASQFAHEAIARDSLLIPAYVNLAGALRSTGNVAGADSVVSDLLRRFDESEIRRVMERSSR